jgi:hypothetical protein
MNEKGDISFNRRRDIPGKEKKIVIAENMIGKPLGIKIRSNAYNYEIYKKDPAVDKDWQLVTDGHYQKGEDDTIQFRWGAYTGQKNRGTPHPKDMLYFVSGTTIR